MSSINNGQYTANFQNKVRVRTVYYKVDNAFEVCTWWSKLLGIAPHKLDEYYSELKINDMRIGFVKNDWGEKYEGNRGVVMLETEDWQSLLDLVAKIEDTDGKITSNNLENDLKSVTAEDPFGNEFELGNLEHD